jgi:hypothetical protein
MTMKTRKKGTRKNAEKYGLPDAAEETFCSRPSG